MTNFTAPPPAEDLRPSAGWEDLRSAALSLASRRWPVLPGTYRQPGRDVWCGRRDAGALEPVTELVAASTDPVQTAAWWACEPYSVLLATGRGVDVIEVAAEPGRVLLEPDAAGAPRGSHGGPIAVAPGGAVLVFVRSLALALQPGGTADPAAAVPLPAHPRLRHHGPGSWVALPPTTVGEAGYRWRVWPSEVAWRLPEPAVAYATLLTLLG